MNAQAPLPDGEPSESDVDIVVRRERDDAGNAVLRVEGELDLASSPELREAAETVVRDEGAVVSLELSGVQFMDSSGLALLLEIKSWIPTVRVVNPSPAVRRIIAMSGLEAVLTESP